jgi:exosortase E/protease (VPEID-CTERM system)
VLNSLDRTLALARQGMGLGARVAIAGGVLLLEKTFLNLFVHFDSAQAAEGLGAAVSVTQHWGFRFITSFGIATFVFAYLRGPRELQDVDAAVRGQHLRPPWLIAHLVLFASLVPLCASLYAQGSWLPFGAVVTLWIVLAIPAAAALFAALAPWPLWQRAIRAIGPLWWYALIAAAGAVVAMGLSQGLWTRTTRVTFEAVYRLLGWLVPGLQIDPANRVIDTGRFAVSIDPVCSGLEGMGLVLVFCSVLLLLFRREYIFPRALLLIPAGLFLSFILNIIRIAVLVLIGDSGYAAVAVYGFHSQAGWIAFNAVAVGIALVSLRSKWFNRAAGVRDDEVTAENPTAVYLLPFLALIIAGMASRAVSGGFEGLYWLRLVGAGAALCYSWPRLRGVDWRVSRRGAVAGLVIFLVWITAARVIVPAAGMPPALAALPSVARGAWIFAHALASVVVVPVAEELAFRGYLLRRIRAADFESIAPREAGVAALIISAVVFGLFHGALWLPGTIAGLVLGVVYMRTQGLGEAVAAHITANGLIAAVVLTDSQWQLW